MKAKGKGNGPSKSKKKAHSAPHSVRSAAPTIVQMRFQNEGPMKTKSAKRRRNAPNKSKAITPPKTHHSRTVTTRESNPPHRRHHRRHNPKITFVSAIGKVLGGAAAMFGSGVLVTLATAKVSPGNPMSLYGFPALAGIAGAAIATRYPIVGVGVAAGGAAPFVLPVASRMMAGNAAMLSQGSSSGSSSSSSSPPTPSTVQALRAVAMGSNYRAYGRTNHLGAVSMGRIYAD